MVKQAAKKATKKARPTKAVKPKPVKVMSDELDKLRECEDIVKRFEKCEGICNEREFVLEEARRDLKEIKGAYHAAVIELRKLARIRKEKHPLFDKPKTEDKPADKPQESAAPAAKTDGVPAINYNQPSTAVTIKLTKDRRDIDPQMVSGNTYHPWSVSAAGVQLLLSGTEFFLPTTDFEYVEGRHLVDAAMVDRPEGFNAVSWEAWLRQRPEAVRPTFAPRNDAWKDLPLEAANINGKTCRLLIEAGHDTLGKLSRLMGDHGQWWPKEVKGIGESGATEIADRFAEFWAAHPEFCAV